MKRRTFLAGMGTAAGAGLFAPLLRQARAGGPAAKRVVFVIEGNGTEPVNLMSPAARDAIDAQATSSTTDLRAFPTRYGHNSALTVSDDLSAAIALDPLAGSGSLLDLTELSSVVLGLSSTITGGGHNTNFGALSSTRSNGSRPAGPTIDAVLAALPAVRGAAPFDCVRLGVHSATTAMNTATCAFGESNPAPILIDPTQAFINLFGVVGDASTQAAFARKGRLLDYALADVDIALSTFSGSSDERAKLETYLSSLEVVQDRQLQLSGMADVLAGVAPDAPSSNPLYTSTDPLEQLQATSIWSRRR